MTNPVRLGDLIAARGVRRAAVLIAAAVGVAGCSDGDPDPAAAGATTPRSVVSGPPAGRSVQNGDGSIRPVDAALIEAAWRNDLPAARRLIEQGADVDAPDDTRQSAFLIAASEGYLELLELTLADDADVRSLDRFNGTALIRAAERGHTTTVGRLVAAGVAVNHVNNLGWTALHEAILLGDGTERYQDTVRVLLAGGADPSLAPARDGIAPVEHARTRGLLELQAVIEAALAGWTDGDPDAALLAAASAGDADTAMRALRAGAALEARDRRARTPLLLASAADRRQVARLLVALGADPDALDDQHDTPWLVTGVTGSVPMLEILLPARPDLTIRNRFGGVSVIPASERGHVQYVRRVVQTGIDVNHVNDLGWTALLEAVILGDGSPRYQQIVQILLEAGADPTIGDHDGVTALEHARRRGQADVARLIAAAGPS
jgi:uncharacterized protein